MVYMYSRSVVIQALILTTIQLTQPREYRKEQCIAVLQDPNTGGYSKRWLLFVRRLLCEPHITLKQFKIMQSTTSSAECLQICVRNWRSFCHQARGRGMEVVPFVVQSACQAFHIYIHLYKPGFLNKGKCEYAVVNVLPWIGLTTSKTCLPVMHLWCHLSGQILL